MVQMDIYRKLVAENIITDKAIHSLHDTNLHYEPYQHCGKYVESEQGFAHQ